MEFVIVLYPTERDVFVGGGPLGKTGKKLKMDTGTHTFDLDVPLDYTPASQTLPVSGTTKLNPLLVLFVPKPVMRAGARRGGKKITKRTAKKTAKETAKKVAKTVATKTAKKVAKRTAKKAVKKTARKSAKKVAKKAAKKMVKKSARKPAKKSARKRPARR